MIVTNTPDVLNDDVANMAIALLLATSRRICAGDRHVRSGAWLQGEMPLARSASAARSWASWASGASARISRVKPRSSASNWCYHGRKQQSDVDYRYYDDLVAMARDCDYLVVICPGGEATRNLVNRAVMDALGPEGVLINVARGTVVDEPELVLALQEGKLGGAGLDVFLEEPKVPDALFAMDQVVLQPHAGSATVETRRAMGDLVVQNLRAHIAGKPVLTPVT